ncbi:Uncharacterised protein [Mycobacteroides abscessus subsp. abscessus]|nr:Uncharacterised protein [Mycobacteroides abscessus subsp. abscessus]
MQPTGNPTPGDNPQRLGFLLCLGSYSTSGISQAELKQHFLNNIFVIRRSFRRVAPVFWRVAWYGSGVRDE